MPGESALSEAQFGTRARWGYREHLLADIVDRLNVANWITVQVNRADGETEPFPELHPRPGTRKPGNEHQTQDEFASPHEVAEFFSRLSP
jgi:hypothetical protein